MLWVDGQISSYFFPLKISIPTRWTYKEKEHQLPSIPWSQMPLKSVLRVPYGASCPLRATCEMRFSSHPLLAVWEQPKPREGPSRILSHFRSSTIKKWVKATVLIFHRFPTQGKAQYGWLLVCDCSQDIYFMSQLLCETEQCRWQQEG